jgi:hypothetical protein
MTALVSDSNIQIFFLIIKNSFLIPDFLFPRARFGYSLSKKEFPRENPAFPSFTGFSAKRMRPSHQSPTETMPKASEGRTVYRVPIFFKEK